MRNYEKRKVVLKRTCQNEGSALCAEISQIYPKSFILCIRTLICIDLLDFSSVGRQYFYFDTPSFFMF